MFSWILKDERVERQMVLCPYIGFYISFVFKPLLLYAKGFTWNYERDHNDNDDNLRSDNFTRTCSVCNEGCVVVKTTPVGGRNNK